jgi:hypothetical protein
MSWHGQRSLAVKLAPASERMMLTMDSDKIGFTPDRVGVLENKNAPAVRVDLILGHPLSFVYTAKIPYTSM